MANLEQILDMLEYQDVWSNIRAHLIAAIGQIIELAKRAQVVTHTSAISSRSHRSRISQNHGSSRCNDPLSIDAREGNNNGVGCRALNNQGANRNAHGWGLHRGGRAHRPDYDYNQYVNQDPDYDLRRNLPP